jgi:hypothetical protein
MDTWLKEQFLLIFSPEGLHKMENEEAETHVELDAGLVGLMYVIFLVACTFKVT